jgi:hypothetical protein
MDKIEIIKKLLKLSSIVKISHKLVFIKLIRIIKIFKLFSSILR